MDVGLKLTNEVQDLLDAIVSILPKMDVGLKGECRLNHGKNEMFQSYLKWMRV